MSRSATVAAAVVSRLVEERVTDVVLAPGSRSAPLALACFEADAAGRIRLHVRIDERTAGFLALGLAKGSHRPVPVVTTSGSAVAHLHAAVLEALHVGERVIVLSADRPAELRRTGANQTTEQAGMFGSRVPTVDVPPGDVGAAVGAVAAAVHRSGPSQVNLQFAEPLVPPSPSGTPELDSSHFPRAGTDADLSEAAADISRPTDVLAPGPRTVVVAGDGAGPPARLLAEPTSGARTGSCAIRTYRLLLGSPAFADRIQRVVVTGHPTLSRPVTRLISRSDIEVISAPGPDGVCTDPGRVARHVDALPTVSGGHNDNWLGAWKAADAELSSRVDDLVSRGGKQTLPLRVAAVVAAAVTPGSLLFAGSSSPVRDLDVMADPYPAGERRLIIGNRGLSGIDGSVSTAVGAALGRPSPRALAYIGDLSLLHDASGLVLGPDEPRPDLTFVVPNDNGGAIFATLEQGDDRFSAAFERVFGTPHRVDMRALCTATGTSYERIEEVDQLRERLSATTLGIRVLEVPVSRADRRRTSLQLEELAADVRPTQDRNTDQAPGGLPRSQ